jgi:hypothetical protein
VPRLGDAAASRDQAIAADAAFAALSVAEGSHSVISTSAIDSQSPSFSTSW